MYLSAPYLLLIRAHSAYRLAASCAFSGQAAELHPLLRLMLEQGGYASLIYRKPKLQGVWMDRKANPSKVKKNSRQEILREFLRHRMQVLRVVLMNSTKKQSTLELIQTR